MAKFKVGDKIVCMTRNWYTVDLKEDFDTNPKFNEIVTVASYSPRLGRYGLALINLVEYPNTSYAEIEFAEYISDTQLASMLKGIKIHKP